MKTMLWALSFTVLAGLATACGGAARGDGAPTAVTAIRPPGEARIGDRTTCPVSGEEFIVSTTSPHAEHGGKTYYFCCSACAQKFEAEPAKFLRNPPGVADSSRTEESPP